jgi:AmmeMemoRadiSam system protein B
METRKPSVAGMFYPANPIKLKSEVERCLGYSKNSHNFENVYGLVAPHAGYVYSGRTAGYAYNQIAGRNYKTVIVISPSHREYFPGISVYDGDGYETPLGVVEVDKEMREFFVGGAKGIFAGKQGHKLEHALEVQLPFLQTVIKDFKLLPVVMGDQNKMYIEALAEKLKSLVSEDVLIVASSDLSHYHSQYEANKLDVIIEEKINAFDYGGLQKSLAYNYCEACGGGAIVSLMKALSEKNNVKGLVLHRTDSSETSGDTSEVVGYLSAAFYN